MELRWFNCKQFNFHVDCRCSETSWLWTTMFLDKPHDISVKRGLSITIVVLKFSKYKIIHTVITCLLYASKDWIYVFFLFSFSFVICFICSAQSIIRCASSNFVFESIPGLSPIFFFFWTEYKNDLPIYVTPSLFT